MAKKLRCRALSFKALPTGRNSKSSPPMFNRLSMRGLATSPTALRSDACRKSPTKSPTYYREHGLILAQAFVPVQEVDDGEVTIQVLEGLLGRVVTEGNELYQAEILQTPFRSLIGQPVTKEAIETALLTVSRSSRPILFRRVSAGYRSGFGRHGRQGAGGDTFRTRGARR